VAPIRNIFACLVHENPECVIDLVRNLHFLDPASEILLYNGGQAPELLNGLPLERYGAVVHPSPRPMAWGRLHEFALDCMQFALDELHFDTLTIVDSDQLGTRPGYSEYLAGFVGGRGGVGLLGSSPGVVRPGTPGPAQTAFREIELWRPYLRRFRGGEQKFVHWSFWPSTVFLAGAARELTQLFARDVELRNLMACTRIWATEEVILPTLVALLGYEIAANPCSYDYVKYRTCYTPAQIDVALDRGDVLWVHPIPRQLDNGLRGRIRNRFGDYETWSNTGVAVPDATSTNGPGLVLSVPILNRMRRIRGWLEDEEADLLIASCSRAVSSLPEGAVVEVGSFCGRSTVVLGSVVQSLAVPATVYAIDPHDGVVGALDSTQLLGPTLDTFRRNIAESSLTSVVEAITSHSFEVTWEKPVAFLLIDGLHDYGNVSRDFRHFEPWLMEGGYVAFHDYADYYPGVKALVDEILALPHFERVHCSGSMIIVRKIAAGAAAHQVDRRDRSAGEAVMAGEPVSRRRVSPRTSLASSPLASCIMATANRRAFVPQAIQLFLRQDYPNRELIILDDGEESVADLIPDEERIRYLRLTQRFSMGTKHNMACEMAQGAVIVHWDDDDWQAEWRLSYQIGELLQQSPDTLCGLSRVLFYEPRSNRAWEYSYPGGRSWVLGATFCYRKRFWERNRFPDMNEGADTVFVWNLQNANVIAHQDSRFFVGTVHSHNTSPKRTETSGWRTLSSEEIRGLLNSQDWSFYERFGVQDSRHIT
jgi:hypothetical protein